MQAKINLGDNVYFLDKLLGNVACILPYADRDELRLEKDGNPHAGWLFIRSGTKKKDHEEPYKIKVLETEIELLKKQVDFWREKYEKEMRIH